MILWFQFAFDLAPVLGRHGRLGVVLGAAEPALQGRGNQRPLSVVFTERAWAELTEGDGGAAALPALVPRTLPLS